jgi:hypothetical protein
VPTDCSTSATVGPCLPCVVGCWPTMSSAPSPRSKRAEATVRCAVVLAAF